MRTTILTTAFALVTGLIVGCGSLETAQDREQLVKRAQAERQAWIKADPSVEELLRKSHGYALFPEVGSGGFIVAGSGGTGVVFERGQHVGYAELSGASIGFTAGGQKASELIVFENKAAMDRFREGKLTFGANANAVIVKSGAAATAPFTDGVAVLVRPLAGAMAEASLGGQNFKFIPR
jgi:lipid-binding SYLF domain-containing protein